MVNQILFTIKTTGPMCPRRYKFRYVLNKHSILKKPINVTICLCLESEIIPYFRSDCCQCFQCW